MNDTIQMIAILSKSTSSNLFFFCFWWRFQVAEKDYNADVPMYMLTQSRTDNEQQNVRIGVWDNFYLNLVPSTQFARLIKSQTPN